MTSLKALKYYIYAACIVGIIVSGYALFVEMKIHEDDNYEAMCDIAPAVKCSDVLSSRWGRGFGVIGDLLGEESIFNVPNSVYGLFFYSLIAVINRFDSAGMTKLLFRMSVASNLMSLYLAYILFFLLHDVCLVCLTTYTVNLALLILSRKKKNAVMTSSQRKQQ